MYLDQHKPVTQGRSRTVGQPRRRADEGCDSDSVSERCEVGGAETIGTSRRRRKILDGESLGSPHDEHLLEFAEKRTMRVAHPRGSPSHRRRAERHFRVAPSLREDQRKESRHSPLGYQSSHRGVVRREGSGRDHATRRTKHSLAGISSVQTRNSVWRASNRRRRWSLRRTRRAGR